MTLEEALRAVRLGTTTERMAAADALSEIATIRELPSLELIRSRELDHYVRAAIDRAIGAAGRRLPLLPEPPEEIGDVDSDEVSAAGIRAAAIRETTARIVHELNRVVGKVGGEASLEIEQYDESRTRASIERLISLIDAVDRLSRAAAVPVIREFDVGSVIRDVAAIEAERHPGIQVVAEGPDKTIVRSDSDLLRLILHNAISNACEAVDAIGPDLEHHPVAVSWGATDRDVWISILDRGVGLASPESAFLFGETTKVDHHGVGLALAKQAADSLGARVTLESRRAGGSAFEVRVPTGSRNSE
jgi:signal transduction histidine kinase